MSTTRKDIRVRVGGAAYVGDMISSTALTGSSVSQIVDTTLKYADNVFVDSQVVITSGNAMGDIRNIVGWTPVSGILLPDANFTAAIAAANTYEIHHHISVYRKNEAINQAILDSKWKWAREIEDETVAMVANQFTYSLASLSVAVDPNRGLEKLEYDPGGTGTGYPWVKVDPSDYEIRNSGGTLTLQLLGDVYAPGDNFRLTYEARPVILSTDAAVLAPDDEGFQAYVCARATAILMEWRAMTMEDKAQQDKWLTRAQIFQSLADNYFAADAEAPEPGTVRYPTLRSGSAASPILGGSQDRVRI